MAGVAGSGCDVVWSLSRRRCVVWHRCIAVAFVCIPRTGACTLADLASTVRHTDKYGHVLFLKLLDGNNSVLPVYIGDFECAALVKEINKRQSVCDRVLSCLVATSCLVTTRSIGPPHDS